MPDREKIITIFGAGKAEPGDELFETAYQTAKALAGKGFTIANGGYGGTMLASAKGASQVGGKVLGVTCSVFGGVCANEYVTEEIVTGSLSERLRRLVELGDGFVVLPGGTGTLLELAEVWELKNKGFPQANKPIIMIGSFWKGLIDLIAGIDAGSVKYVEIVSSPQEAVDRLDKCV